MRNCQRWDWICLVTKILISILLGKKAANIIWFLCVFDFNCCHYKNYIQRQVGPIRNGQPNPRHSYEKLISSTIEIGRTTTMKSSKGKAQASLL